MASQNSKPPVHYDINPNAAANWVAAEVKAGRLPDAPRTQGEIDALFTPENVVKHMTIGNPLQKDLRSRTQEGGG